MKNLNRRTVSLGLALFGPRLIRTVGEQITKLNEIRGYCVAVAAAATVLVASALGLPVSRTMGATGTRPSPRKRLPSDKPSLSCSCPEITTKSKAFRAVSSTASAAEASSVKSTPRKRLKLC